MKRSSKRFGVAFVIVTLLAVAGTSVCGQGQTQDQAPRPARSRSDEMLDRWNDIGNKLVATMCGFQHPQAKHCSISASLLMKPGRRSENGVAMR